MWIKYNNVLYNKMDIAQMKIAKDGFGNPCLKLIFNDSTTSDLRFNKDLNVVFQFLVDSIKTDSKIIDLDKVY